MPITYTTLIDWNDDGDFSDSGENISADVLALDWRLGMTQPHQHVAPPAVARVTVRSRDRRYSPEVGTLPLTIGKRLRIQSDDGSTVRTHFTGFIESVEPKPGEHGERTSIIHAATPDAQFPQTIIRLPPLVNARSDNVILTLLDSLPLRRAGLANLWVLEIEDYGELDSTTRLAPDETVPRSAEAGISTFAYVGELWNIPADDALRQVVESERGRFFVNREGTAVFYNRHHALISASPAASFEDDMEALTYAYGDDFANCIRVSVIPRKVGEPNSPLWTLENPQRLPPGVRRMIVSYRAADGSPMGALDVSHLTFSVNSKSDGTGVPVEDVISVIIEPGASAATLEFRNESGATAYLMPGAQLIGTPLLIGVPIEVEHADYTSITFHGQRMLTLNVPLVDSADEADQMARYESHLRHDPRGVVTAIETSTRTHPQQVLARTLFDRIVIGETQTGHDSEYLIIGEAHEVDLAGTRHRVRWTLERADPTLFWQVESSHLDQTTIVAY
jgi:hypothetical protein